MQNKCKSIKDGEKWIILFIIIVSIIIIDQSIKCIITDKLRFQVIDGVLNLIYVENTGVAYGIGRNDTYMVITFNIIILAVITICMILKKERLNIRVLFGLGLILGGGLSNLIDRVFRGFVIDYIDFTNLIKFSAIFNFADICIVLGIIITMLAIIINEKAYNKKI